MSQFCGKATGVLSVVEKVTACMVHVEACCDYVTAVFTGITAHVEHQLFGAF